MKGKAGQLKSCSVLNEPYGRDIDGAIGMRSTALKTESLNH